MSLRLLLLTACTLLLPALAAAQAFDTMRLEAAGVWPAHVGDLATAWRAGAGGALGIAVSLGRPDAVARVRFMPFDERQDESLPDFALWTASFGVRLPLRLGALALRPGVHTGIAAMTLDPEASRYARVESELLLGASLQADVALDARWRLFARAEAERLFLSQPIDLVWLHFGTAYRVSAPSWLRDFLR